MRACGGRVEDTQKENILAILILGLLLKMGLEVRSAETTKLGSGGSDLAATRGQPERGRGRRAGT